MSEVPGEPANPSRRSRDKQPARDANRGREGREGGIKVDNIDRTTRLVFTSERVALYLYRLISSY